MQTIDMTLDQLDAAISLHAGRALSANEAFELCEANGLSASVNIDNPKGDERYVCRYGESEVTAESPVLAIKRAYVLKNQLSS